MRRRRRRSLLRAGFWGRKEEGGEEERNFGIWIWVGVTRKASFETHCAFCKKRSQSWSTTRVMADLGLRYSEPEAVEGEEELGGGAEVVGVEGEEVEDAAEAELVEGGVLGTEGGGGRGREEFWDLDLGWGHEKSFI
ncbi:uncharacterized protein A4U43_C09F6300 [Asparagus officinalis]|uniref:Uncharacterized protein n=1 Tax=Asparagus officinalis TaxID=4686 RepID=A0A5P1E5Z0_ASPOF|nr:uncharacterized protein A4U43_C09F6300 [Asparagus officinalis]